MASYFDAPRLLASPPVTRAAWSDRTAWIMAELARLAYEPLPAEVSVTALAARIREAVAAGDADDVVEALVRRAVDAGREVDADVAEILRAGGLELLETFAAGGTEALLARLAPTGATPGMLVLAFRGTQPDVRDVLTDIRADLVSAPGGGRIHRGFLDAFERVHAPIAAALERHRGPPVYMTGHSLGGALALAATRYLESDGSGACYTFGAPRAADDTFFAAVKTPVYRVVNAADGVARVPFGFGLKLVLGGLRLVPLSGMFALSEFVRRHFAGYTHYGYLVFLSAAANVPDADDVPFATLEVRPSPNFFWRSRVVLTRLAASWGKAAARDHRVREYAEKLRAHALRRNPERRT